MTHSTVNSIALGSTPGLFSSFQSALVQTRSVPASPSCAQYALKSLCTLKIPQPPFCQRESNGRWHGNTQITYNTSYFTVYNCIIPMGFLPWKIRVAFPGESQLRHSRATRLRVHAGCFSVSIIHRTLTWTTGSLTCVQM